MTTNPQQARRCPNCRSGSLVLATRARTFEPRGRRVEVILQTSKCDACGAEATSAAQHRANLEALAARKAQYGGLLLGEEILALRRRYGLTQQDAAKIFGKGKIAFSRYENEVTYPDDSTTLLLQLAIEQPAVIKSLAAKAGVSVPLWRERCEDEQRVKLRMLPSMAPGTFTSTSESKSVSAPRAELPRNVLSSTSLVQETVWTRQTRFYEKAVNDDRSVEEELAS